MSMDISGSMLPGGLVCNDELGAVGQGAGNGHTLLLAAGEFIWQTIHLIFQTDKGERERYTVPNLFSRDIRHAHGKSNVLVDRHRRNQAEVLEHNAHLAAQIGYLAPTNTGQVLAVDKDLALRGLFFHLDEL